MFLLKLLLVPCVILILSMISKRFGSAVAGLFAGFPIISGPILFLLSVEHGATFGEEAAEAMILGVSGVAIYAIVYATASIKYSWAATFLLATFFFYTSTLLLVEMPLDKIERFICSAFIISGCYYFIPNVKGNIQIKPIKFEILYRMVAGVLLLYTVTYLSNSLGAKYSGVISSFPVTAAIIPTFLHAIQGKEAAIQFLKNLTFSLFSMCVFFTYLSYELSTQGLIISFSLALTMAMLLQGSLIRLRSLRV